MTAVSRVSGPAEMNVGNRGEIEVRRLEESKERRRVQRTRGRESREWRVEQGSGQSTQGSKVETQMPAEANE